MGSASTGRLLNPPIVIPPDAQAISISPEGEVSVRVPQQAQMQQVGTIELVSFINPEGLLKRGENLYSESDASGAPVPGTPGRTGWACSGKPCSKPPTSNRSMN